MMVTASQVSFLCSLEPGLSTSRRMWVQPAKQNKQHAPFFL
jgi:hypothetical protein